MNSMIPRNVQKMINAVQYDTRIPVWLHEGMPLMEDHKSQDEKCEDFIKILEEEQSKNSVFFAKWDNCGTFWKEL